MATSRSVRVVPKAPHKTVRESRNMWETQRTQNAKSGAAARSAASKVEASNKQKRAAGRTPKIKVGKTVVSSLAKGAGSGGVAGLALGAMAAFNQEAAKVAKAKRKENRMN